jgi:hypothetical protein
VQTAASDRRLAIDNFFDWDKDDLRLCPGFGWFSQNRWPFIHLPSVRFTNLIRAPSSESIGRTVHEARWQSDAVWVLAISGF